jgi:dipeptidyl aminopeptidase/acylaminoacyl peptidase
MGAAALAATVIGLGASTAHAAYPGENGKIAFATTSFVSGSANGGIWTLDPTTRRYARLTSGDDIWPTWSADGTRIAFERRISEQESDIYVMNADGSGLHAVTSDPGRNSHPTWSPGGEQIAYSSAGSLYVIPSDGGPARSVRGDECCGQNPAWSPDGELLAYASNDRLPGEHPMGPMVSIWTIALDGGDRRRAVRGGYDHEADWSPDGSKLAISDAPNGEGASIANADGTGRRWLATEIGDSPIASVPTWSPDGRFVAYAVSTYENLPREHARLAIENAATGDVVALLDAPEGRPSMPDWQPVSEANHKPNCSSVRVAPRVLWPANGKLRPVRLLGGSDPDGDRVTVEVAWVGQDEPVRGRGDRTAPDAFWTANPRVALLRAERARRGDGRVYWVDFWVTDEHGARCGGTVEVTVPRHRNRPAIESPFYASSVLLAGESKRAAKKRRNRVQRG